MGGNLRAIRLVCHLLTISCPPLALLSQEGKDEAVSAIDVAAGVCTLSDSE